MSARPLSPLPADGDHEPLGMAEAREQGFECVGVARARDLRVRPEVRDMCAADRCRSYGRSWTCPPACGALDEFRALLAGCRTALLVQTVAKLEDEFDIEGMQEAARLHGKRFGAFARTVRRRARAFGAPEPAFLGAGACTTCPACGHPHEACRFPDRAFVSMEAAGLMVGESCAAASIPYNHGPLAIAYTGCLLA